MELRYYRFIDKYDIKKTFQLNIEDLNSSSKIEELFNYFNIKNKKIKRLSRLNTNLEKGFKKTLVKEKDVEEYYDFLKQVPQGMISKIDFLKQNREEEWIINS